MTREEQIVRLHLLAVLRYTFRLLIDLLQQCGSYSLPAGTTILMNICKFTVIFF